MSVLALQRAAGNAAVVARLRISTRLAAQRVVGGERSEADSLGNRLRAAMSGGAALAGGLQRTLEGGLGADLSALRVHTGPGADRLAGSLGATAFTSGSHLFFRAGAYQPRTRQGLELVAHEATHAVQQASGPVAGTAIPGGVSVSDPGDRFERDAACTARRIVSGLSQLAGFT